MQNIVKISSSTSSSKDKLIKRMNQIQAPKEVYPHSSVQKTSPTDSRRSTSSRGYDATMFQAPSLTKSTQELLKARTLTLQRIKQSPQLPTSSTRCCLFATDLKNIAANQSIFQRVIDNSNDKKKPNILHLMNQSRQTTINHIRKTLCIQ